MKIDVSIEKEGWSIELHGDRGTISTPDWTLQSGKLEILQKWLIYQNDAPDWVQSLLWAVGKILNEEEVKE